MNTEKKYNSVKEVVLGRIEDNKVKMRSHSYFVGRTALIVTGVVIIIIAVVYLVSFLFFVLGRSGAWFLTSFGWRGLGLFLISFPWFLGIAVLVFVVLLELFVKRFSFAYRKPLLYSMLTVTVLTFAGGFAVSKTSFHHGLYRMASDGHMPIAGAFYNQYGRMKFHNTKIGIVTDARDDSFYMETYDGDIVKILIASTTNFRIDDIQINDAVMIIGQPDDDDVINALGIRKIDHYLESMPSHFRGRMRMME